MQDAEICRMENKKKKIGVGCRVGSLTVEEATEGRKSGYTVWRCRCDCGGEILLDTRCLQRGTVTDCGCMTRVKPGQRDITGERFGRLTAQYPTEKRGHSGSLVWHCKCDCGGEIDAPLHQLSAGYRKSCGCLSHRPLPQKKVSHGVTGDNRIAGGITGKVFGKLTVLEFVGLIKGKNFWKCRCECGNETVVQYSNLISGHTKSCGCLQKEMWRENLKLIDGTSVTLLESGKNRTISSNTSGYTGVYRQANTGKWAAQITFKGKTYYLGAYDRIEDAHKARKRGEEIHDDFLEWYKNRKDEEIPPCRDDSPHK